MSHLSLSLCLRERVEKIRVSALRVSVPGDLRLLHILSTPGTTEARGPLILALAPGQYIVLQHHS